MKLKTLGKITDHFREEKKPERCQQVNQLDLETLARISTDHARKSPRTLFCFNNSHDSLECRRSDNDTALQNDFYIIVSVVEDALTYSTSGHQHIDFISDCIKLLAFIVAREHGA